MSYWVIKKGELYTTNDGLKTSSERSLAARYSSRAQAKNEILFADERVVKVTPKKKPTDPFVGLVESILDTIGPRPKPREFRYTDVDDDCLDMTYYPSGRLVICVNGEPVALDPDAVRAMKECLGV